MEEKMIFGQYNFDGDMSGIEINDDTLGLDNSSRDFLFLK